MKYSIAINQFDGVTNGIVGVALNAPVEELPAPITFNVSIRGEGEEHSASRELDSLNKATAWIGIHSHLLPNGNYEIEWSVTEQDGTNSGACKQQVTILNEGDLADNVRGSLKASGTSLFILDHCDSKYYDYTDQHLEPWYNQPDAHEQLTAMIGDGRVEAQYEEAFRHFIDEGWTEFPNHVGEDLLKRLNADLDDAIANNYRGYEEGSSQRMPQLHLLYRSFWDLYSYPKTESIIDQMMQTKSRTCQSLTFAFGSQQAGHQDTVHLTPFPGGYMCGAWVALEDVREGCGELMVFPKSHRWPTVRMSDFGIDKVDGDWTEFGETVVDKWKSMSQESGIKPFIYRPKAGTMLLWHESLFHGGSRRIDESLSRRSCVTHHFAEGGIVYYDSFGLPGKILHRRFPGDN